MIYRNYVDDTLSGEEVVRDIIDNAYLLGYDDLSQPEQLNGFIKTIVGKIASRVRARREARKAAGQPEQSWALSTPGGAVSLKPDSADFVQITSPIEKQYPVSGGGLEDLLKNPMVLIGGAAIVFLLLMQQKK